MRIRSVWGLIIVWGLITAGPGAAQNTEVQQTDKTSPPPRLQILRDADRLVEATAKIRGLEPTGPIQKGVKSREEITSYLMRKINEEYLPERIQREGQMFKKLGLLPEKVDYQQLVINLLT